MSPAQRRYIAIEATIGAVISGVLSLAFCFLIFGGMRQVPVSGAPGLLIDALPQSFMIALMATIVPTLLTRSRVQRGTVAPREAATRIIPKNVLLRSLLVATAVAAAAVMLAALLLLAQPESYPFEAIALAKTGYGTILGGIVAAMATRMALADGLAT